MIKSSLKYINSNIKVEITEISFNESKMENTIKWEVQNPNNEDISRIDLLIYSNDTSSNIGRIEFTKKLHRGANKYVHQIDVFDGSHYKVYAYQIIVHTTKTTKSSQIERFNVKDIFTCIPPDQITFKINHNLIIFNIRCKNNRLISNIFVYKKNYNDDTFYQIAALPYGNQQFIDKNVILGNYYEYRFMSYDIFGQFSQKIVKINLKVWTRDIDKSKKNILSDPVPIAELGFESSLNKPMVKVKISNTDANCQYYKIMRKDISDHGHFSDIEQWYGNNIIKNNASELQFNDVILRSGSYYQYSVTGADKFGNISDIRISNPVFIGINENIPTLPINVKGTMYGQYPTGVRIEWEDGNLNQQLSNIISGSSDLFPKENLYYFRVFRRRYDELNYQSFPEQSASYIEDWCDDDGTIITGSYYKPLPPVRDNVYYYYVKTFSSNGIESNRSPEILMNLTVPPKQLSNITIYYNSVLKPLKAILLWNFDENDKTIDSFVVERIDKSSGAWIKMGRAYFSTKFIDDTVQQNKKYMYRIKAEDFNGNQSPYIYAFLES